MKAILMITILGIFTTCAWAECPKSGPCIEISDTNESLFEKLRKTNLASESKRTSILEYAKSFIGTPYLYGGETRHRIDCSAFVQTVFSEYGLKLPRTSRQQFSTSILRHTTLRNLQPVDLIFFSSPGGNQINHVAIYLGDGKIIHSSRREGGVQITDIKFSNFWGRRFHGARRPPITKEFK